MKSLNKVSLNKKRFINSFFTFASRPHVLIGAGLGLAVLILYTVTMAPDILPDDCAEWQATAVTLGVSHSPGEPLYSMVGHLFTMAPLGTPAARVTFLSVILGAVGVVAAYAFVLLLLGRLLPALVAAASLAFASLWWSQASVATPYTGVVALMAVLLVLLMMWQRLGDVRFVYGGTLLAGAGLGWHPSLLFFLPLCIAGIFLLGPWRQLLQPKRLLILGLLAIAGLSSYLYLPIRSAENAPILSEKIDSFARFIKFVSASGVEGQASPMPDLSAAAGHIQAVVYGSYFRDFTLVALGTFFIFLWPGVWRRIRPLRRWLALLLLGFAVQVWLIATLAGSYDYFFLPLLLYFSVWTGLSVYLFELVFYDPEAAPGQISPPALAIVTHYVILIAVGLPQTWSFANHRNDHSMRNYVESSLGRATPNAIILATWPSYTGFVFAQKVEGQRPDVIVAACDEKSMRRYVEYSKRKNPGKEVLASISFNWWSRQYVSSRTNPMSFKGITYQDFNHGQPYPLSTALIVAP